MSLITDIVKKMKEDYAKPLDELVLRCSEVSGEDLEKCPVSEELGPDEEVVLTITDPDLRRLIVAIQKPLRDLVRKMDLLGVEDHQDCDNCTLAKECQAAQEMDQWGEILWKTIRLQPEIANRTDLRTLGMRVDWQIVKVRRKESGVNIILGGHGSVGFGLGSMDDLLAAVMSGGLR